MSLDTQNGYLPRVVRMLLALLSPSARFGITLSAGLAAGVFNAVAGGGTFVTFPTLLALGVAPLQANLTSAVGVLPSYLGGIQKFSRAREERRALLLTLFWPSLAGSLVGCALLLLAPPATFRLLVPWLIGVGTALFTLSPWISRKLSHLSHDHPARRRALVGGVFFCAIYGGYFGAGLGILLMATMALTLPDDIFTLTGLRVLLALGINLIAALVFVVHGQLDWWGVVALWMGTLVGGYLGSILLTKLSPSWVRACVILVGAGTTIKLAMA